MPILQALRFLYFREFHGAKARAAESHPLHTQEGGFSVDVYRPRSRPRGCILLIHGMSLLGKGDPRIVSTADALARSGYQTFVPAFESIRELVISPEQLSQIQAVMEGILCAKWKNPSAAPAGEIERLGVFAPSFSASLALKAGTKSAFQDRLGAFCLIGGYADIETTLDFLFCHPAADEYGRLLVLANIISAGPGGGTQLARAFLLAARANGQPSEANQAAFRAFFHSLSRTEQALYERLLRDTDYRRSTYKEILAKKEFLPKLATLDVMPVLSEIRAPVILIHGADDDVISSEQSCLLHERLRALGKQSHLCISRLISHGDTGSPLSMLAESRRLIRAFQEFFRYL